MKWKQQCRETQTCRALRCPASGSCPGLSHQETGGSGTPFGTSVRPISQGHFQSWSQLCGAHLQWGQRKERQHRDSELDLVTNRAPTSAGTPHAASALETSWRPGWLIIPSEVPQQTQHPLRQNLPCPEKMIFVGPSHAPHLLPSFNTCRSKAQISALTRSWSSAVF